MRAFLLATGVIDVSLLDSGGPGGLFLLLSQLGEQYASIGSSSFVTVSVTVRAGIPLWGLDNINTNMNVSWRLP